MILTNRLFTRREPEKDAKSIYIFCEGKKREYQYFRYFRGIESRINIEVYPLRHDENNSPRGLYDIACVCLIASEQNPNPKYEFVTGDEVWFVVDTDQWIAQIGELKISVQKQSAWQVAQSNPCFEVWLYFHEFETLPEFPSQENCLPWRQFVANNIPGGFDPRRHPVLIETAIQRAETRYSEKEDFPEIGSTQVFRLGKVIFDFCREKILEVQNALSKI